MEYVKYRRLFHNFEIHLERTCEEALIVRWPRNGSRRRPNASLRWSEFQSHIFILVGSRRNRVFFFLFFLGSVCETRPTAGLAFGCGHTSRRNKRLTICKISILFVSVYLSLSHPRKKRGHPCHFDETFATRLVSLPPHLFTINNGYQSPVSYLPRLRA